MSCLRGRLRTQEGADGHVPWSLDIGACGLDAGESFGDLGRASNRTTASHWPCTARCLESPPQEAMAVRCGTTRMALPTGCGTILLQVHEQHRAEQRGREDRHQVQHLDGVGQMRCHRLAASQSGSQAARGSEAAVALPWSPEGSRAPARGRLEPWVARPAAVGTARFGPAGAPREALRNKRALRWRARRAPQWRAARCACTAKAR